MTLASTRTHTHFFSEDDLAILRAEVKRLQEDWDERATYIREADIRAAADRRLAILQMAVELLAEPAD